MSKSKSAHSLASATSPPKQKPTPTKTGALTTAKKTKPPAPTTGEDSASKYGNVRQGQHENGNGVEAAEETLHPEIDQLDAENHEPGSDREAEHLGNGSLEVSYIEEPLDASTDDVGLHDHEEVVHCPTDQEHVETPQDLIRSPPPESVDPVPVLRAEDDAAIELPHEVSVDVVEDEEQKQEEVKDDIADIVGLLESTSFTSKHILQGSDEGVVTDLHSPGPDKERQRIGEIPDEE